MTILHRAFIYSSNDADSLLSAYSAYDVFPKETFLDYHRNKDEIDCQFIKGTVYYLRTLVSESLMRRLYTELGMTYSFEDRRDIMNQQRSFVKKFLIGSPIWDRVCHEFITRPMLIHKVCEKNEYVKRAIENRNYKHPNSLSGVSISLLQMDADVIKRYEENQSSSSSSSLS